MYDGINMFRMSGGWRGVRWPRRVGGRCYTGQQGGTLPDQGHQEGQRNPLATQRSRPVDPIRFPPRCMRA